MPTSIPLTVLVPLYEYREGFNRILRFFIPLMEINNDFILIFSDDSAQPLLSPDDQSYLTSKFSNFKYISRNSTFNAVDNWNSMLSYVETRYFILLHHDECFSTPDEFFYLLSVLKDCLSSSSHLSSTRKLFVLNHTSSKKILNLTINRMLPRRFAIALHSTFPFTLFSLNLLGPTSCIVFPRSSYRFDSSLKWIVDSAFYYIYLCDSPHIINLHSVGIQSYPHPTSISSGLTRFNRFCLRFSEIKYLSTFYFPFIFLVPIYLLRYLLLFVKFFYCCFLFVSTLLLKVLPVKRISRSNIFS